MFIARIMPRPKGLSFAIGKPRIAKHLTEDQIVVRIGSLRQTATARQTEFVGRRRLCVEAKSRLARIDLKQSAISELPSHFDRLRVRVRHVNFVAAAVSEQILMIDVQK